MFDFGKANEKQKEAISTVDGPVLITAGPGTGKTYTLVMRAMYLMQEKKVDPGEILIATFTEKAAGELITRITNEARERRLNKNIGEMYIGTFHSICGKILQENLDYAENPGLRRNYRVMDGFEQKYRVFKNIGKFREIEGAVKYIPPVSEEKYRVSKEPEYDWRDAKKICGYVGQFAEELITPEELMADEDPGIVTMGRIMEEYRNLLGADRIDYAGLQVECYNLLKNNSEILKKVRDKIRYIMVDEYQDTNYIQEQLVMLLGGEHLNICVVGDDDQALYRFRNATVKNILNFHKRPEFEKAGCHKIKLEINHRSNKKIIDFYNKWMRTTESKEEGKEFSFSWEKEVKKISGEPEIKKFRHDKTIVPRQDSDKNNDFEAVLKLNGRTEKEWHERVAAFLKELKDSKRITDYNQCAFLFFSVKRGPAPKLAEFLEEHEIPVYSPRSKMFFKREEIMLALGCFLHLFPKYKKYRETAGQEDVPELYDYYNECFGMLNEPEYGELREALKGINPAEYGYTALIYRLFGYYPFRDDLDADIKSNVFELRPARNLASLTEIIGKYESMNDIKTADDKTAENLLDEYIRLLYGSGIDEYEDAVEYAPKGCVSFMTVHQAKGMEFPIVFVDSLFRKAADLKPKKPRIPTEAQKLEWKIKELYARKDGEKEDDEPHKLKQYFDFWRFYYTAFSRAQDLLVLTCYENDVKVLKSGEKFIPKAPSVFFLPVYKDLVARTVPDENIKFEKIKKADLKDKFSFTGHIAVYDSCPLQYKFNKELGFRSARHGNMAHAEFGTLVHETIEDVHRAVQRGEEWLITEERIAGWLRGNYNSMLQSDAGVDIPEERQAEALQHVLRYVARLDGKWEMIQDAEVEVMMNTDDYIIEGKIDLVKGENNTVEIVDFKTTEQKPKVGDYHYNRYKKQLELYAILLKEQHGYEVSRMHLYYTSEENDPLITFEYTDEDVQKTREEFDATARKIMAKDFSGPVSTKKLCEKCDFRFYCGNRTMHGQRLDGNS